MQWTRGEEIVSDDRRKLDMAAVHRFIAHESHWARGISRELLDRALDNSLCFGVYRGERQIGFARMVTDRATFGYLCDVFVDQARRGAGLGRWLVKCVLEHPDLQG